MPTLNPDGRLVSTGDTRLQTVERCPGYPALILHGGPSFDHPVFGDYLDPVADGYRLILVNQRNQGPPNPTPVETQTLQQMAAYVTHRAEALGPVRNTVTSRLVAFEQSRRMTFAEENQHCLALERDFLP